MSGLDDLRDELVTAAEHQARPRARWRPRVPRGLALLAALAVLGGGTATALTVVSSSAPDDPYDPVITAGTTTVKAIPLTRADRARLRREREARAPRTDARRSFSVLARPAGPRDALPDVRTGRPVAGERPYDTRLAVQNEAGRVYVHATDREVCIHTFLARPSGASGSCAPTVVARERGVIGWTQCAKGLPPQARRFAGVVPDGVREVLFLRAGVVQARAPVTANGFAIIVEEPIDAARIGNARVAYPPVVC